MSAIVVSDCGGEGGGGGEDVGDTCTVNTGGQFEIS